MNFLENCRKLVGLDSTPSHGNLAVAEFVGGLCEKAGLHVEYQRETVEGVDQCNVIARPQSTLPAEEVLFQTHLDTSEAGHFHQWTMTQANPFNASIYNDLMYGLGTADVKLDFLCKLEAMKSFIGKPLKTPFVLAGTFGAQNGMTGAIKLIRRKKLNAKRAFIGQPTGMKLVTAGKGLVVVEIAVPFSEDERLYRRDHDLLESSSSQSRMFNGAVGENAIVKMLGYLAQLPDGIAVMDLDGGVNHNSVPASAVLEIDMNAGFKDPILPKITQIYSGLVELEKELQHFQAEGFDPPYATMNMGKIRTFDDEIRITGCCHLPPSVTDAVYEAWMKQLESAVKAVGARFRVRDYRKGFLADESSGFVKTAQALLSELGLDPSLERIAAPTEASVFGRLGIECVVWGPGQSAGNSLVPNENVKISELRKATEVYQRLIERYCQ